MKQTHQYMQLKQIESIIIRILKQSGAKNLRKLRKLSPTLFAF